MPPEQAQKKSYNYKVDIWAVGIIQYQLLNKGKHPLYHKQMSKEEYQLILENLKEGQWKFPPTFNGWERDFFTRCCKINMKERFDAKRALQHPWIAGVKEHIRPALSV